VLNAGCGRIENNHWNPFCHRLEFHYASSQQFPIKLKLKLFAGVIVQFHSNWAKIKRFLVTKKDLRPITFDFFSNMNLFPSPHSTKCFERE
jgi:hypothetical protein